MTVEHQTEELPWHLKGNWAPVQDELSVDDLHVDGEIPSELRGLYLRNGMNPRSGWSDHWFFGNGMVHGVEIKDGKASYRNRFVRTPYYENDMGMMDALGDPKASPANTHVVPHAGKILCVEEAHVPWEIDRDLNTVGPHDWNGQLTTPFTAHPRVCPETGELLSFGYTMLAEPYLRYYRVDAQGQLVQNEPIEIPQPVMMHDWNVTRNHVIFMDLPLAFSLEGPNPGFGWRPESGARLGVMPRTGTNADVKWYEIDPCYVFHPLNAHEEGDKIVLYVCRQPHAMKGGMQDIGSDDDTSGRLWRWTIDTKAGTVKEEQLDDAAGDFPRVDDRRIGLPAKYGYVMGLDGKAPTLTFDSRFFKYELETGRRETHDLGAGWFGGEPSFAPRSADAAEDDGWVVSIVYDANENASSLVVLNAQDFEAAPVAKIRLPRRVPFGAHGYWLPEF